MNRSNAWERTYFAVSLAYPWWYLVMPDGAGDPWWIWWLVSATYVVPAVGASLLGRMIPHLEYGFMMTTAVHIFTLAALNEMAALFAVGSVISGTLIAALMPSVRSLHVFGGVLAVLCGALAVMFPHPNMLAYWFPFLPLLVCFHYRLQIQATAGDLLRQQRLNLEHAVEVRTRKLEERERQLTESNVRLRAEIEERKRLEERLVVSQKLEALGRLAGGVAHDVNNFITTIFGYAEFALDRLAPDHPSSLDLKRIERSAERATELVNQLLAFSRRNTVEQEIIDLDVVLGEMASVLDAVVPESVELRRTSQPGVCIIANRSQIEQVILNLVGNARDAMPDAGAIHISIVVRDAKDEALAGFFEGAGRYALLSVSDTGVGMDDDVRSRIFDPFFTTKQVSEGTGLGLSIVHGIVRQSDGHLRVHSQPGAGTTLEIAWPCVESQRVEQRSSHVLEVDPAGSERVLLVEDEPEVRRLVHRALVHHGYDVLEAHDADMALKLAAAEMDSIDLVVADIVMPRMSGIELVERIAALKPDVRVIFISGHIDHPSLRSGALPEGTDFLPKPFGPEKLARKVREVLDAPLPRNSVAS